jgi:hypothetical protein
MDRKRNINFYKKGNAYQGILVMVLISILLIGMYFMMMPFATIYNMFTDDSNCQGYTDESTCGGSLCTWEGGVCKALPDEASSLLVYIKKVWLIAPIIFIVGLIIYLIAISTKRDPQVYTR